MPANADQCPDWIIDPEVLIDEEDDIWESGGPN